MSGNKSSEGQVLLLLIMVMGTLLIVAMTAIFQGTTQTQIGGINQISQSTLAAAEAGLEKALQANQSGTFKELGLSNLSGINLEASTVEIREQRSETFNTAKLEQDEQYTFYLSDYSPIYPYFGTPYAVDFRVYYESPAQTCEDVSLEFTVVYDEGNDGVFETSKLIADGGDLITTDNTDDVYGDALLNNPGLESDYQVPPAPADGTFQYDCRTQVISTDSYPFVKFMLVQNYFSKSKIGFQTTGDSEFPPQGKTIKSTARARVSAEVTSAPGDPTPTPNTQSGLTRIAEIFQSYPQIPAEFWITSF